MAKTYHAERLKRYPRDKNVYHDHDNCPELNPLHEMTNQSHSEGASLPSLPTVQMCHLLQIQRGSLLSRTRQDGLQRDRTRGGVEHEPEPVTELLEL